MENKINWICREIEDKENIKILFAVGNGSRVWRMESSDSDYDVRFVFVRPVEEYIQIELPDDVIWTGFNREGEPGSTKGAFFDVCGFDIFKFVRLLYASNPTVIEWLISDIVYYGKQNEIFKKYALEFFNPKALFHHYKSMSRRNYDKYINSGRLVTYKKYLYIFRGVVNALWVLHKKTVPPIIFIEALEGMKGIIPKVIIAKVKDVIKIKSVGKEKERIERIKMLDDYIEEFLESKEEPQNVGKRNIEMLNMELRRVILNSK